MILNLIIQNQMEIQEKLIDSTLINSLGWKSKTKLKDGIELTYKWFLNNLAEKKLLS